MNNPAKTEWRKCPVCGALMAPGRAGMWLHYLEVGCDYIEEIERLLDMLKDAAQFLGPLANQDAWISTQQKLGTFMDYGTRHLGPTGKMSFDKAGVITVPCYRGELRISNPHAYPWDMVGRIVNKITPPF